MRNNNLPQNGSNKLTRRQVLKTLAILPIVFLPSIPSAWITEPIKPELGPNDKAYWLNKIQVVIDTLEPSEWKGKAQAVLSKLWLEV